MRLPLYDEVERLSAAVLDGTATPAEIKRFNAVLRDVPELAHVYFEQSGIHAMLECSGTASAAGSAGTAGAAGRRRAARFVKIAAAAAALAAAGAWVAQRMPPAASRQSPVASLLVAGRQSPVEILNLRDASGVDVPESLPGKLSILSGTVKVRLPSRVELTLLGPLHLDIIDPVQVRMHEGRMITYVSATAGGITVLTPDLEMWDIGTVFSVSVSNGCSSVFVLEGEVQVVEASGEAAGLCAAGEGVRFFDGHGLLKYAADWTNSAEVFDRLKVGRDDTQPPDAVFAGADQIAAMWADKYLPEEHWRIEERIAKAEAERDAASKPCFTKAAWTRPVKQALTAPAPVMAAAGVNTFLNGARIGMTAVSDPNGTLVDTSPLHNRHWMTVRTNEVELTWDWPDDAMLAQLQIASMNSGVLTCELTPPAASYVWRVFADAGVLRQDMYEITLKFFDADDEPAGALTARLASVPGALGSAAVMTRPEEVPWPSLKANRVIPYDAGWAAATEAAGQSRLVIAKQGGREQVNTLTAASGYFGWQLTGSDWGYGTFSLSLSFPGIDGVWDATLLRVPKGTVFFVQ